MEMFYNAQDKQRQALWQEWLPGKRASKNALGNPEWSRPGIAPPRESLNH